MNKDQVKDTIDELVGSVKRKAGELTDDTPLQIKGIAQQVKGKVENAWGNAKEGLSDAIHGSDVRLDTHIKLGVTKSEPETETKAR